MQLSDYYHNVSYMIFSRQRKKLMDAKIGNFSYIPQGFDVYPHHALVFSKPQNPPSEVELNTVQEALNLTLRQFTRKYGHVLIEEIEVGPRKVAPPYIYVTFTWTSATVADFGSLSKSQEAVSTWWLREVSKQQDADKHLLARIHTPEKRTWQQPSILPE